MTQPAVEPIEQGIKDPTCAGIRFAYTYQPAGGDNMPVTPPT